jgi:hypothetical protein
MAYLNMAEIQQRADAIKREKTDYWIYGFQCVFNAYYNTKFLKNTKTHKVRCGGVWYKGTQLFGGNMNIEPRKFYYGNSHAWVETTDGKIIDWVINEYLEEDDPKKCVWDKKEMEALGFEYRYYDQEEKIEKKLRKQFGSASEFDRQIWGNWKGSSIKTTRMGKEYNEYAVKRRADGKEVATWYYYFNKDQAKNVKWATPNDKYNDWFN